MLHQMRFMDGKRFFRTFCQLDTDRACPLLLLLPLLTLCDLARRDNILSREAGLGFGKAGLRLGGPARDSGKLACDREEPAWDWEDVKYQAKPDLNQTMNRAIDTLTPLQAVGLIR